jgi:hypothetical protein
MGEEVTFAANDRKSAALRILEIAHEIDREAFLMGETVDIYDWLRAIASRLHCNSSAAKWDHESIGKHLAELTIDEEASAPEQATARRTIALIQQAANALKPFAGAQ